MFAKTSTPSSDSHSMPFRESQDSLAWIVVAVLACAGVMVGSVWIVAGVWIRALDRPVLTSYFVSHTPHLVKGMCGVTLFVFAAIVVCDAARRFFNRKSS